MPKNLPGAFHAPQPVSDEDDPLPPPPGFNVNMILSRIQSSVSACSFASARLLVFVAVGCGSWLAPFSEIGDELTHLRDGDDEIDTRHHPIRDNTITRRTHNK